MENPDIKISILAVELLKDYKVAVSEQKLYKARTIALGGSNENHKESYNKPFIGIEGCHLRNIYGGMLLSAVRIDANCGIFPLLYVFVKEKLLRAGGGSLNTCISIFMYMYANFKAEWKGPLYKTLFYTAMKTCNVHEFKATMQKIWNLDKEAYNYMMEYDPKHWSRHAFDPYICTDHVTNNITKCWNGVINKFRRQPALTMLESIRRKLMKKLEKEEQRLMHGKLNYHLLYTGK
ncbi:hypothetical protein EZV62_004574 [Acer yangbiense]|uniref:MULE transposase domain-containing protein n=1 Tax=Acer yangbiense TaxID=1000413 RepID=A0A5C7IKM2_9ROSI|nr:hypothetical protein EZV62_004574 [Acer yangbiense]